MSPISMKYEYLQPAVANTITRGHILNGFFFLKILSVWKEIKGCMRYYYASVEVRKQKYKMAKVWWQILGKKTRKSIIITAGCRGLIARHHLNVRFFGGRFPVQIRRNWSFWTVHRVLAQRMRGHGVGSGVACPETKNTTQSLDWLIDWLAIPVHDWLIDWLISNPSAWLIDWLID